MIKENMFFGERTLNDYRDIKLDAVIREYLLAKGTWDKDGKPTNKKVSPKELVSSALYVYELKSNATNKRAMEWYCERAAKIEQIMDGSLICIPAELWEECDRNNRSFCGKEVQATRIDKDKLKTALYNRKEIADIHDDDPLVTIYLSDLIDLANDFKSGSFDKSNETI